MNLSSLMFIFRHSVTSAGNVPSSQECTTLDPKSLTAVKKVPSKRESETLDPDRKDCGRFFSISDDEPNHYWKCKIGSFNTANKECLYGNIYLNSP